MRTRLQDIADRAGVSVTTVSRVVNAKPGVADETRETVLRHLEELGYEHPVGEVRGRSGLVGLIVPELANPVFPAFAEHLGAGLVAEGYTPLVCTATPLLQEQEYLTTLLDLRIDGLVVVSGRHANTEADHRSYRDLQARGVPLVLINGHVEQLDAAFLSADEEGGTAFAVEHLRRLGHRRIGCAMGPARYTSSRRKVAGFRRATRDLSWVTHTPDGAIVHSVYSVEGGRAAAEQLLDRGVTAVVCGSDLMAIGALAAAAARGMVVPDDVSVIGYDDAPLMAYTGPPLTTVRQDVPTMCSRAVSILTDQLRGASPISGELVFRTELVVRNSTAPAR